MSHDGSVSTAVDTPFQPLRSHIDRLEANHSQITGWTGDEMLLSEIIASLRGQVVWLEQARASQIMCTADSTDVDEKSDELLWRVLNEVEGELQRRSGATAPVPEHGE